MPDNLRKNGINQTLELVFLAQKVGLVHRHQVGELLQLLARCLKTQHGKVAAKIGGAGSLDAFNQALVHKVALGRFEADAGPAIEKLLELQKVFSRNGRSGLWRRRVFGHDRVSVSRRQ